MIRCIHNGIVINGMSKSDTKGAVLIENGIIADVFTEAPFTTYISNSLIY